MIPSLSNTFIPNALKYLINKSKSSHIPTPLFVNYGFQFTAYTLHLQLPDYDRLSHSFVVIAEETSKLPNVAAIQEAHTLTNIMNALAEIRQSVHTIQTEVVSLRTDVTTLRTDVTSLRADVTTLRTDVTTLQTDMTALRTDVTTLRADLTNRLDTR